MPATTSVKNFFPGKTSSGHMRVNSTPYVQASASPADNSSVADVQPNGQFGNPSGKTTASPLSTLNGVVAGAGRGRKQP